MNLGSLAAVLPTTFAALAMLAAPAAVREVPAGPVTATTPDAAATVAMAVVTATNAQRAAVGAGPVVWNGCLQPFAQRWATTLAGRGSLAHQGLQPLLTGCALSSTGENVAMGYDTAASVVAAWMASPGHRANLLNPTFTQISVGLASDGTGRRYWVMDLGAGPTAQAPGPPAPTPTPAGRSHARISRAWTSVQPQR